MTPGKFMLMTGLLVKVRNWHYTVYPGITQYTEGVPVGFLLAPKWPFLHP